MSVNTAPDPPLQETVAPCDEAAVAALIAAACESGTPVYPIGGGTSLDYGPRPAPFRAPVPMVVVGGRESGWA